MEKQEKQEDAVGFGKVMVPHVFTVLEKIQKSLNAPKDKYNSYGSYFYRSCESIIEAAKKVYADEHVVLNLSDRIELVGARYYVVSTATLKSLVDNSSYSVEAWAREPDSRKGMDESQVTGSSSSYARKYALNGLFAIDDSRDDPDAQKPEVATKTTTQPGNYTYPTVEDAIKAADSFTSREQYKAWWSNNKEYQKDKNFIAKAQELGNKFPRK